LTVEINLKLPYRDPMDTKLKMEYRYKLPNIGGIAFTISSNRLTETGFFKGQGSGKTKECKKIKKWINAYLEGKPAKFPYTLEPQGSDFQKKVWKAMQEIPYGETRTYKWIAEKIGKPGAYRAVGNACGANPIPLIIPCHRVVASNGIGGFSCGLSIKRALLDIEGHSL